MCFRRTALIFCFAMLALLPRVAADETPDATAASADSRVQEAARGLRSEDEFLRQKAFLQLEALRDPAAIPFIRPYADSKDPDTRAWSLRALVAIQGMDAAPLLSERLKTDKQPAVRRAVILGLEPLLAKDPSLVPLMIDSLDDRSPEVRIAALDVVSRIDQPDARNAVRARAKKEGNRDVRKVLVTALDRILSAETHAPSEGI